MQLILCWNSSEINVNHQNNILTVATDNHVIIMPMDTVVTIATGNYDVNNVVATVVACFAIADLVPPVTPRVTNSLISIISILIMHSLCG
jgi:hypothetical protein